MTNPDELLTAKAAEAVKALYGGGAVSPSLQVQVTRKEFEGDYTLVTFPLLKMSGASPENTGKAIGDWLVANCPEISGYNVVKGFLNVSFSPAYWKGVFREIASNPDFGMHAPTGKTIMVEFSSPNTNKPLHLGHIRNNLLGWSVSKLLEANGHRVLKVNLVNDYYVAFNDMYKAEVEALTAEGMPKEEAEKNAPSLKEAQDMLLRWEKGDKEVVDLWKMMNGWVYEGFDKTYRDLGISFDRTYYESQTYLFGKALVQKGLDMGIFEKEADGSVWCDLTADGLDRKLLLRGDGTSVYMTQDLGTAEQRFEEYNLDEHIYVVGNEQNYHFQVLKLILGKLGFSWADNIYHLSYGMVELPQGKMKSREGTVVDADDLIQNMYETAKETSMELGKLDDMDGKEREDLFRMIGLGALKYFIIKVDPKKTMLFNPAESIDFNGNTGPFIQYTHARIRSILRKAAAMGLAPGSDSLSGEAELSAKEIRMVKMLNQFPTKIAEGGAAFSPAVIANYAYDLAKEFNQYYHDTPILREKNQDVLLCRLTLVDNVAAVLRRAMGILGISLPERM